MAATIVTRTAPSSGSTTLVSQAYPTHAHHSTPRTSRPCSTAAQPTSWAIRAVHWVTASTNTRSKNSSSGITRSASPRRTAVILMGRSCQADWRRHGRPPRLLRGGRGAAVTLVALGDSITNGGGGMALGVYPRSWAHWLALAMDVPYHGLASDGADAHAVLHEQVPRLRERYSVGALYVGVNDVRRVDWDAAAFERDHHAAVDALTERCARVVTLTVPLDLGRPRAGAKVRDCNAIIRASGATVVALDDLRPFRHLLPDAVHPHALGQLEIADRAARALNVSPLPSTL